MATTWFSIGVLVIATIISGFAPIFLKKGAGSFDMRGLLRNPLRIIKHPFIILGVSCDLIAAVLNIIALRFGELSVLTPISALTYIWACLFSVRILKERMTQRKWLGVSLIVVGVVLVTLGRAA